MGKSLLFLIAILVTGIFALIAWSSYLTGKASETWPMVEGKILESGVNETEIRREGLPRKTYHVQVVYEYIVDGQRLTADRLSFTMNETSRNRTEMVAIANGFPIGKSVPVYFNPDKPTEACLEKGLQDSPLFAGLWSIGFLTFLKKFASSNRNWRQWKSSLAGLNLEKGREGV